jgi:HAMP domain-containing protein
VRNIAEVTTAVARGDLSRKITVDVKGEILELKNTINTMVDQLNAFAGEVTRVAREVGTEGKLGGQAQVPGVAGTWKDLTDTVNVMAANLTEQVRGIVKVVTAVANGDLRRNSPSIEGRGRRARRDHQQHDRHAGDLRRSGDHVAREVGVEGRLGGQANVPGAAGTWKDLTGNVNLLAANLTTQVRAIAEVATAVTKGDLTRSIQVEARGEVAELKDNINTMIDNLRLTTERNTEQDWLKTNLARFTACCRASATWHRRPMLLSELGAAGQRAAGRHLSDGADEKSSPASSCSGRLCRRRRTTASRERSRLGEGLVGQCARQEARMLITEMPPDHPHPLRPGEAAAQRHRAAGAVREARSRRSSSSPRSRVHHLAPRVPRAAHHLIGIVLNTIEATMQTEGLLKQSQQLAGELQTQQKELQQTNEQLAQKAQQLAEQNVEVERKNQEIEQARRALEEKGRRAGADLEVQVGIPGQHVARAAHAAQQHPDPRPAARREPDGNLTAEAGRVRPHHPRRRHRPAQPHQRHSRSVEDRVRHRHGRARGDLFFSTCSTWSTAAFRHEAENRAALPSTCKSIPISAAASSPIPSACSRCSRTCCPTPSSSPSRAACASTSRRRAGAGAPIIRCSSRRRRSSPSRCRHRHRHPPEKQKHHLRGLPAGRRRHQPQIRRHRPRPGHQPRAGQPARRRNPAAQRPGQGSTFTLYLPLNLRRPHDSAYAARRRHSRGRSQRRPCHRSARRAPERAASSRSRTTALIIQPGDKILLIVEDDPHYARILVDLARDKGFKVLVAMRGAEALDLAKRVSADRHLARRLPAPTCSAGPCSASSSRIRSPATSRCRSSPWTKIASTAWRAAPSPSSPSRRRPRASRRARKASRNSPLRAASGCLIVEDNPPSS